MIWKCLISLFFVLIISVNLLAQVHTRIIRNVEYGESKNYRTSYKYDQHSDLKEVISSVVEECYSMQPSYNPLHLDLYVPSTKSHSLVVLCHEGAFQVGDKSDLFVSELAKNLQSQGVLVASINYSLGFKISQAEILGVIHSAVQNLRGATRFVLDNYSEYLINDPNIIYGGASAGGIAALTAANLEEGEYDRFVKDKLNGSFFFDCLDCTTNSIKREYSVNAVFSLWGGIFNLEIINSNIPSLLIHGTDDKVVQFNKGMPFCNQGFSNKYGKIVLDRPLFGSKAIKKENPNSTRLQVLKAKGHSPYIKSDKTIDYILISNLSNSIFNFIKEIQDETFTVNN